jgi:16S rRNA processing protein RimM
VDGTGKTLIGPDEVVIARILKPRGIRGEVACTIETDAPRRFELLKEVTVALPGALRHRLTVEGFWFHKGRVIVKFAGYDTMSAAEMLAGGVLVIPQSDALPLEHDEFYEHQVVGSEVVDVNGRVIGVIGSLLRTGGTDVLVVQGGEGREYLIPFTGSICIEVDVSSRRVIIDPPEGLLEL